jgi:hypothetical protein
MSPHQNRIPKGIVMAVRKASAKKTTTKTADFSNLATAVKPSGGLPAAKSADRAPNPLAGMVNRTREEGPLMLTADNEETRKAIVGFLRRDAQDSDCGVRIRAGETNELEVHFQWKPKSNRKYTHQDIRNWYAAQYATDAGPAELVGPIPAHIRQEFRLAMGFEKGDENDGTDPAGS